MYSKLSAHRRQNLSARWNSEKHDLSQNMVRISKSQFDSTSTTLNTSSVLSDVIIVIMEGRGKFDGRIGISMHNIRCPEVYLCEFIDSREYSKLKTIISVHRAFDIVIPAGHDERGTTKLLGEALISAFPNALLQSLSSKFFNNEKGVRMAKQVMNREVSNVGDKIFEKTLAMSAFIVMVKYIQETKFVNFRANSVRLHEIVLEDCCMIDVCSWDSLEIIDDSEEDKFRKRQQKQRRSLFDVLDHTITENGKRLLRSNVLQPSANIDTIESRQEAVMELVELPQLTEKLAQLLSKTHELDRVLAMCIQTCASWTVRGAESNVNQMVKLLQTLKIIGSMRSCLTTSDVKSPLLQAKIDFMKDDRFERMMAIMDETLCDQPTDMKKNSLAMRNVKCFAIREGASVNLDVARKAYIELLGKIEEISEQEIVGAFQNANARLSYSLTRGFHYTMVTKDAQKILLPKIFTEVIRNKSTITFSSRKLISANDRINQVVAEVFLASDIVVADLIEKIQPILPVLYYAMDALSTIDFLCSLATYAISRETIRPSFGESFSISQGRNAILDWENTEKTVSNDTCLTRDRRFGIITGPNMAGKSTYLKQIAQFAIMAQIGSLVPAEFAIVPVFTRIFSRMGHNDELTENKSAFACEMNDAATIIKSADANSLVLMDELARSTSTEEGIAITYAICEEILAIGCYTLLATHFLDISCLTRFSTAVENYHFHPPTDDAEERATFMHKLLRGPYQGPLYGFELVKLTTFPDEVISHAKLLAQHLRSKIVERKKDYESERRRLKVYVWHRLTELADVYKKKIGPSWKDDQQVIEKSQALKNYLVEGLKKIDEEEAKENKNRID